MCFKKCFATEYVVNPQVMATELDVNNSLFAVIGTNVGVICERAALDREAINMAAEVPS
jgi:hypothetical protein